MKMIKKTLMILSGCFFILILAMVGSYGYFQFKLKELTPEVRANLPGSFVELEDGVISYYWKGPEDGGNVITFAGRHPERVKELILIAPAGYVPEYTGLASLVLIPGLGDWLMTLFGKQNVMADIHKEVEDGAAPPDMVPQFEEQFQYRGYLESILSTMRHYPMYDLSEYYEAVGRLNIPTYAIWGTDDQVVPFAGSEKVKKAIPHVKIFAVEGAGHSVPYARAKEVNAILRGILE